MATFQPVFVKNRNVRNFSVMMDGIALSGGEGRLGLVYGQAGRGKTRTVQQYAAHNDGIYLRMQTVWRTSELQFLQELCRELGHVGRPIHRKGPAFAFAVDRLIESPRPIFLDEIEKLQGFFLEVIRDLSDMSTAPVILIGEEELKSVMQRNRRVWSRTFQQLAFEAADVADGMIFAKEATGLQLTPDLANLLHRRTGGNMREMKRTLINLVQILNARGTDAITPETIEVAVKTGLEG